MDTLEEFDEVPAAEEKSKFDSVDDTFDGVALDADVEEAQASPSASSPAASQDERINDDDAFPVGEREYDFSGSSSPSLGTQPEEAKTRHAPRERRPLPPSLAEDGGAFDFTAGFADALDDLDDPSPSSRRSPGAGGRPAPSAGGAPTHHGSGAPRPLAAADANPGLHAGTFRKAAAFIAAVSSTRRAIAHASRIISAGKPPSASAARRP